MLRHGTGTVVPMSKSKECQKIEQLLHAAALHIA